MRLKASLGLILLGLGACTTLPGLPGIVRIEVDGSTLEFKKDPNPPARPASQPRPQPQPEPQAQEAVAPTADGEPR
jgi:hypothetical protein